MQIEWSRCLTLSLPVRFTSSLRVEIRRFWTARVINQNQRKRNPTRVLMTKSWDISSHPYIIIYNPFVAKVFCHIIFARKPLRHVTFSKMRHFPLFPNNTTINYNIQSLWKLTKSLSRPILRVYDNNPLLVVYVDQYHQYNTQAKI